MLIGGIVGDGHALGRIFPGGSLSALYAPGIASPRHIVQSNIGLFWKVEEKFQWLTGMDGLCSQSYETGAAVLVTRFHYDDVRVELRDCLEPNTHVLLRRVLITNPKSESLEIRVFHLEASSVAENKEDFSNNLASYARGEIVRYRGHPFDNRMESPISLLFSFQPTPVQVQCGVSYRREGHDMDAYADVEDGQLTGNTYAFHHAMGVTSAAAWDFALQSHETAEIDIYLTADYNLASARERVATAQSQAASRLEEQTMVSWRAWLDASPARNRVAASARERQWWDLSLSILRLLQDAKNGAVIAAPSVNPDYRYCWPRDAALVADALSELGYADEATRFFQWCVRAQADNGHWYQNYYVDGRRHWPALQVDQSGTVVWSMSRHLQRHRDCAMVELLFPSLARATDALVDLVTGDEKGLTWSEQDLWEETAGYFLYTNSSVVAAFREAALLAAHHGLHEPAARWGAAETKMRKALEHHFVDNGAFIAALDPDVPRSARKDCRVDVSMLGVVYPFEIVDAHSAVVSTTIDNLVNAFQYEAGGIGRYPDDRFFGGNPWPLGSIWLAHVHRLRGEHNEAQQRIDHVIRRMTALGFIPEQSHKVSAEPTSVVPLGWAHAWLLQYLSHS